MKLDNAIGIVELDEINIKCLIFKINNYTPEILSTSITPSQGIHNDTIINLAKASDAIRSSLSIAEKKAKVSIKKINVIFEQPDFLCTKLSNYKKIGGSQIHKDDIEFLLKEAKKQLVDNDKDQSIIHIFNYNYIVDNKIFVEEPMNVYADVLTHEMTFITSPKNNLKNIRQAFINCDIEVERFISRTFALGVELLSSKELELGSVIIDLGFEKISLGLFQNLALVHSITIPFGINHITKDLSKVCSLELEESEKIRNNIDFSFQNNQSIFDENDYLKNIFFINSNFRKISKKLILNVIKTRLEEIIETLKKQLIVPGFNLSSGISCVITGEGSNLFNIDKYFANFFMSDVKKVHKNKNEDNMNLEKNFASSIGAIKIIKDGWETEAIPKKSERSVKKSSFFDKIFGINSQN